MKIETPSRLGFYITPAHACSYLEGKQANTLFADPDYPMTRRIYSHLADRGFRRSGNYLYQPRCENCQACIPVRIPVREFVRKRTHARTWKRNQDLSVHEMPASFNREHQELYCRYIAARHKGGAMDQPQSGENLAFLTASWIDTVLYEMRLGNKLLSVAVVDRLEHGLSAVYTFFDPDETHRSLGSYSILYEISAAQRLGLDWLYLGYWIKECSKMNYKNSYQPLEYFRNSVWNRN